MITEKRQSPWLDSTVSRKVILQNNQRKFDIINVSEGTKSNGTVKTSYNLLIKHPTGSVPQKTIKE